MSDGTFVYAVPSSSALLHGQFLRYDTRLLPTNPAAWSCYTPSTPTAGGFRGALPRSGSYMVLPTASLTCVCVWCAYARVGAVFDGRYVYAGRWLGPTASAPTGDAYVLRYDTAPPAAAVAGQAADAFTTAARWETHAYSAQMDVGALAFDGRFVYAAPNIGPAVYVRYDTSEPFHTASAWSTRTVGSVGSPPFTAALCDGRWVYLFGAQSEVLDSGAPAPRPSLAAVAQPGTELSVAADGTVVAAADVRAVGFRDAEGWLPTREESCGFVGAAALGSPVAMTPGGRGAVCDGRYVYLGQASTRVITRIDTFQPWERATVDVAALEPSAATGGYWYASCQGLCLPDGSLTERDRICVFHCGRWGG